MRTPGVLWLARLGAALLLCLGWPPQADARLHSYRPPAEVLPHASHVVRVAWPPTREGWPVRGIYRGRGMGSHLAVTELAVADVVGALPGQMSWLHADPGRLRVRGEGLRSDEVALAEIIVALYAMDGRYHVVGGRPGHGVPTRSSVWCVDTQRRVYRDGPSMTGDPILCRVGAHSFAVFEQDLRSLLAQRPFEGSNHRPVPAVERVPFFAVVDPAVDWYARRAKIGPDDVAGRKAAADAVASYGRSASPTMAVHVFDALQILAGGKAVDHELTLHIQPLLVEIAKRAGIDVLEPLIQRELAEGPYIAVDRTLLLWVLEDADAAAYRRGVETLQTLCRKQMHNEAVGAYWALKSLGEDLVVQEIDALWAEWDKTDPTSQLLREAEEARRAEGDAAKGGVRAEPPAPPAAGDLGPMPARIEPARDPAPEHPPAVDPKAGPGAAPGLWLVLGIGALAFFAVLLALRRR